MYTNSDFERLFIRYKAEAVPSGESMQSYCNRNKVPYNLFIKWYKDTRHKIVPVNVEGKPSEKTEGREAPAQDNPSKSELRILADIRMSNGMHIRQGNLSYESFRKLVENLEVLC